MVQQILWNEYFILRFCLFMILPNGCEVTCGTILIGDTLFPPLHVYTHTDRHTNTYCPTDHQCSYNSIHFIHDDILWSVTVDVEKCFMGNYWDPHFKNFLFFCFFCNGCLRL